MVYIYIIVTYTLNRSYEVLFKDNSKKLVWNNKVCVKKQLYGNPSRVLQRISGKSELTKQM